MNKLSRRSFLFAVSATTLAAVIPAPAMAAPSRTIVLEAVKDASGKYSSVKVPSGIASELGAMRAAELELASNRALSIAQAQNLAVPKANGLLTRLWQPALKAAPKGIAQALLEVGLVVGLTVALSTAVADLSKGNSTLTMQGKQCSVLSAQPGDVWGYQTGMYRNSSGSAAVAIQRTRGVSTGGTVTPPAGWSTMAQRNATSLGNGTFEWETIFAKNVECGERVAFPPTVPDGSIPGPDNGGSEKDTNSNANRVKIVDGFQQAAKNNQDAKAPIPGGEIPGKVEEPGINIPAPGATPAPPVTPDFQVPGTDYTAPRPVIGADDVHVQFPPEINTGGTTTPTPDPTPSPTPGTSGKTEVNWGDPPTGAVPGAPTPFAWMPTPWAAPTLPGQCTGLPYNFSTVFRGASGTINPCPAIDQARPIIRPVAIAGWTAYAIAQFLDL